MPFKLSSTALRHRRVSLALLTLFSIFYLLLILYMLTTASGQPFDWQSSWPILTGVLLFLMAEAWVLAIVILKNLSQVTLEWHHQYILRINGYRTEHLSLHRVKKIKFIRHHRRPAQQVIKLYIGHRRLYFQGFESMEALVAHFEALPVEKIYKDQHVDWQDPRTLTLTLVLISPLIAFAAYQGELFIDLLYPLVLAVLCIYLVYYRPLSRAISNRFSRFELWASSIAAALSLLGFLQLLFQ